jgi:hypothetical protein
MQSLGNRSMLVGMNQSHDPRELLVSARGRRLEGLDPPHLDPALSRVRRGYFRDAATEFTHSELYRLRIFATADARNRELVFSHVSAAELWGCPLLRTDTTYVHATTPGKARKTTARTKIHRGAIPEQHVVSTDAGLMLTSREWTAVTLAAALDLPGVLLPLDHLVGQINQVVPNDPAGRTVIESLIRLIPRGMKGRARAVHNLRLADARSGSAGESLSRGQMILLDIPRPDLQVGFPRPDGVGEDIVDFDWPELGIFGEFDGKSKYFREEFTDGRSADEILWEEKLREDRIRLHRPRAVRWGWDVAVSRKRLAQALAAVGLHPRAR